MTKYTVCVTRTVVVVADSLEEATTMALYATCYPEHIRDVESIEAKTEIIKNDQSIDRS